jgi:transcription antitermination factor NusG
MTSYTEPIETPTSCCTFSNPVLPTSLVEPRWYAVYTRANHEKCIVEQLAVRGLEHFLPLYESPRKWKDRTVRLQLPLFPGYVFVHFALQNRLRLLQLPGVVRLVGLHGQATPLSDEEVARVRALLSHGLCAEPHPYLQAGRRVRVIRGPLEGMVGVIVRRKNRTRFVVTVESIQRSVAIEVYDGDLGPR